MIILLDKTKHKKVYAGDGIRVYCGDVLIFEDSVPANFDCPNCPSCGMEFHTHGTKKNGKNVVVEYDYSVGQN